MYCLDPDSSRLALLYIIVPIYPPFTYVLPQVCFMEQWTSAANESILSRIDITKMLEYTYDTV